MEIGIDSFAKKTQTNEGGTVEDDAKAMSELIERIVHADKVGLDVFGLGEHHREEFLDSAAHNILAAAAAKTENIRLTSAVAVISAMDPVRLFQNYSTLDLISNGRAEIVAGRGSFTEAFPLFGLDFNDYDDLYAEKLDLLLRIRDENKLTWSGKFRPPLVDQIVYPRPVQTRLPIWVGVGGTPASFVRAGTLGLPLMVAVIGGETHRFKPLIDLYYEAAEKAGHEKSTLKVGLHSLGFVANTKEEAVEKYYPGYRVWFNQIGKERGWPPVTIDRFEQQISDLGAYVIGSPEEVAEKLIRHSKALGGISRFTFQIDNAGLSHDDLLQTFTLIGEKVKGKEIMVYNFCTNHLEGDQMLEKYPLWHKKYVGPYKGKHKLEKRVDANIKLIEQLVSMGVPKKQIIVTGHSCGGLMTLMLFAKHPNAAGGGISFNQACFGKISKKKFQKFTFTCIYTSKR